MNYSKLYANLISRSINRKTDEYTERHHIQPRCLGGTNENINITRLTGREHYIAHLLLWKIYPNNVKLMHAFKMMCTCNNNGKREIRRSSRFYEKARKAHSDHCKNRPLSERNKISDRLKGRKQSAEVIEKRAKALRGKKRTVEQNNAKSEAMILRLANGWRPNMSGFRPHVKGEFRHSELTKQKMSHARSNKTYEEIYGIAAAQAIRLKKKKHTGINNPNFRQLNVEQIKNLLDQGKTIKEIQLIVKAPYSTITKRFKEQYEISIPEYRNRSHSRH